MTTDEMRKFSKRLAGRGANMGVETKEAVSHIYIVVAELVDAVEKQNDLIGSFLEALLPPSVQSDSDKVSAMDSVKKLFGSKATKDSKRPSKRGAASKKPK